MNSEQQRIIDISTALDRASNKVRILRNISWPAEAKTEFFANNASKLPEVSYPEYDSSEALEHVKKVRQLIGSNDIIDQWASRIADKIEGAALMLDARGSKDFFTHSKSLWGVPKDEISNADTNTYDLAVHFDHIFDGIKGMDVGAPPDSNVTANELAEAMKKEVDQIFGDIGPKVIMNKDLASNALAGRRRISIRPDASFTDMDLEQLIEHEVRIHVATSINGHQQPHIKILGEGHAGTTKTQEGLAVFAEFITGNADLERVRRLSDRVLAIQMSIDGANFIEVYNFYLEKTDDPSSSYDYTRRVFRGGLMEGGAPFTKDIVYLQGLLEVSAFLRVAVTLGKIDYLHLLFCGKLDVADIPAIKQMSEMGLVEHPKFCPNWIVDKRYLLARLSYSAFLGGIDMKTITQYYEGMLD